MSKEVSHDAHRRYIQHFVAGDRNSGLEIKDKEEKQMRRILAEIEVPDGKHCIDADGEKCMYYNVDKCRIFHKKLAFEYNGRLPVKCDECMTAGQIRGLVCPIDGDCDG